MKARTQTVAVATVLLIGVGAAANSQGVSMTIEAPGLVEPGDGIHVTAEFVKSPQEPESRLVFVLQMHDVESGEVLDTITLDNASSGYKQQTGLVTHDFTAPADADGVYFSAHAAPWSMNRWVVEKLQTYPTDGTHPYGWTSGHYGTTQDLYYLDQLIAHASTEGLTYCSGVAFETFLLSYLEYNDLYDHPNIGSMTWNDMETFRRLWYGTRADLDPELKLAALAIPEYDLGVEITDWDEVQKGDFVQLWRHSGSGHNPVFINWLYDEDDEIVGVHYWGSQGSSNGIGYRDEYLGTGGSSIDPDRLYFGRVSKPRDQGDIDYALGTDTTESNPTQIVQQGEFVSRWTVY